MQYLYLEERAQKRSLGLNRVFLVKRANLAKLGFKLFSKSFSQLEKILKPSFPPWFHKNHFYFKNHFTKSTFSCEIK